MLKLKPTQARFACFRCLKQSFVINKKVKKKLDYLLSLYNLITYLLLFFKSITWIFTLI